MIDARSAQPMRYSPKAEGEAWTRYRADMEPRLSRAWKALGINQQKRIMAREEMAFRAGYRAGLASHAWSVALGEDQADATATS